MDNIFRKPYIDVLYQTEPAERFFMYPREILQKEPIFPYFVLDGGAFFFITDSFGDATAETMLQKTMSGEIFDVLRDGNGNIDFGRAYHMSEKTGMLKQHEWQSWAQRLYMLLPLSQEFMKTHDRKYAEKWLDILRMWIAQSPYEPLNSSVSHVETTMKWRDMQVSWRSMTLIHSFYMLGTYDDAFTKEEWKEIYDFIILNLSHLVEESIYSLSAHHLGNHTLQMGCALMTAGIMFAEFPDAETYYQQGFKVMEACYRENVMPDGGTKEVGPSYNHFIARMYLEAQKSCELNGYREIEGLHDSVIRQYQWLYTIATKTGRALRFDDAYGMDAHADVERMAEIYPFEIDRTKTSIWKKDSGYVLLRNENCEIAIDAMRFFGGHQHYGRIQPMFWYKGEEILTDTGCCNYDRTDLYAWSMVAESHSVVESPDFPVYQSSYDVKVLDFNPESNTFKASVTVSFENRSYTWTRKIALLEDGVEFHDTVTASEAFTFHGRWYLPARQTSLTEGKLITGSVIPGDFINEGFGCLQRLKDGFVSLKSSELLSIGRTPSFDDNNRLNYNECLTWTRKEKDFSVTTTIHCKSFS